MKVKNTVNLARIGTKKRIAITLFGEAAAKKLESEAKEGAPWVDRTSNARNSIQGNFVWEGKKAAIILSGNMNYSVYLELAMEKRFAILVPTIKRNQNDIYNGYRKVVTAGV